MRCRCDFDRQQVSLLMLGVTVLEQRGSNVADSQDIPSQIFSILQDLLAGLPVLNNGGDGLWG